MILAPQFRQQYFTTGGAVLAGGKIFSYIAGTVTPQATYTDQSGGTPNANPVVLDSGGQAPIWLDPSLAYKFVIQDSSGATIETVDNVSAAGLSGAPTWNANSSYPQGAIVADSSGSGLFYVSLVNNNVGNALSSVANWRLYDPNGGFRTVTANTSMLVTDGLVRSNSTSGSLTHTLPAISTTPINKQITVKDVGTGGNTTTLKGAGTDQVDGNVTYANVMHQYDSVTVRSNGTSWDVV